MYTDTAQQSKGWDKNKHGKLPEHREDTATQPGGGYGQCSPRGEACDRPQATVTEHVKLLGWQLIGKLTQMVPQSGRHHVPCFRIEFIDEPSCRVYNSPQDHHRPPSPQPSH